ncbi:hypothetical protein BCR35DRAFT_349711 [Leucosporidium creatinivorum]|uniref:F-box domain-containing protein n=1 Tax=Leucosporidium creatinivorum TaxID=106004 RepID=A0A1Y2G1M7_9BASI|nr:hypothetical protein BCR35DRAFT_349711 [Leucosporidium creatinivorum]
MSDSDSDEPFDFLESMQYQVTGSDDEYNRHGERWSDLEQDEDDDEAEAVPTTDPVSPEPEPEPLEALPERLVPPTEIIAKILTSLGQRKPPETAPFERAWLWQKGRLVCSAWRDLIEKTAKEVWMKDARIGKNGPMMHTDSGKLMLSANYEFQRVDGDLAIFQELECAPQYHRHIRYWIKDVRRLDCFLGYAVHDLRMPTMRKQKTGDLIITVPWKAYVGHILQEEAFIEPLKAICDKEMMAAGQRLKDASDPDNMDMMAIFSLFITFKDKPYAQRRAQRLGRKDRRGDEALHRAKEWEADYIARDGKPADDFSGDESGDGDDDEVGSEEEEDE